MFIPYSKIIGLPVFAVKNQSLAGHIVDVVLKKTAFEPQGFIIKISPLPLTKHKVISSTDVIELSNQGLVVDNENSISDLKDAVRLRETIEDGYIGIGQKVYTESGKRIGKVFDYLVSVPDLSINKIYVKNMISERILPVSLIRSYKKDIIIVVDDFDLAPLEKSSSFASAEAA